MWRTTLTATLLLVTSLLIGLVVDGYLSQDEQVVVAPTLLATEYATVISVIDGDTIELDDGRVVRYIGIDTPEKHTGVTSQQCYGTEATQKNKELVLDTVVRLEKDVSDTDKYGRLLRYVWVDDVFINGTLVAEGFALAKAYPPDISRQNELQELQILAQQSSRGLWSVCTVRQNAVGTYFITDPEQIEKQEQQLKYDTARECNIKGNISGSGSLYHLPHCPSYRKVLISEDKGERWFCTEQEAIQAGWRRSGDC